MKTYLSKSNHSDPELVAHIRKYLTNLGHEIVEFTGGEYTNKPLVTSDYLVIVPPTKITSKYSNIWSYAESVEDYDIGKGQTEQIKDFALSKDQGRGSNNHINGIMDEDGPTIWSDRIFCIHSVNANENPIQVNACYIDGYTPYENGNWKDQFSKVALGDLEPLDCLLPACVKPSEILGIQVDYDDESHLAAIHMFPGLI